MNFLRTFVRNTNKKKKSLLGKINTVISGFGICLKKNDAQNLSQEAKYGRVN